MLQLTVPDVAKDVVDIWYSPSQTKLLKHLRKTYGFVHKPVSASGCVFNSKKHKFLAIWIPEGSSVSIIGHECIHLTHGVMRAYGESPSRAEETFCVIWELLFNQIYGVLYE